MTAAIVGCGLIGRKRAAALRATDHVVAALDPVTERAELLVEMYGGVVCRDLDEVLALEPDVVVVATVHDELARLALRSLEAGADVLVEKPAGLGSRQVRDLLSVAERTGRRVKVGFNHRFHPGLADLAAEVHSGAYGEVMHVRGRYGHGGRLGYDREWRVQAQRSGGGELIDQGMHLIDLTHWLAGPLPLHSAILRTQFWDTPVEDNAMLLLGEADSRSAAWAMLHVTWTEWKNMFSLEVYCRTAKLQLDGLVGSYGPQTLKIYRMGPELGPPSLEERTYGTEDESWSREWTHFARALEDGGRLLGDLDDSLYAWELVEAAYASAPEYAAVRATVRQ